MKPSDLKTSLNLPMQCMKRNESDKSQDDESPRTVNVHLKPTSSHDNSLEKQVCSNTEDKCISPFRVNKRDAQFDEKETALASPCNKLHCITRATIVVDPEASPPISVSGLFKGKQTHQLVFWDDRVDEDRDDFIDSVLERLPKYDRAEDNLEENERE